MEYTTKETTEANFKKYHMTQPPVWRRRRRFAKKLNKQTKSEVQLVLKSRLAC